MSKLSKKRTFCDVCGKSNWAYLSKRLIKCRHCSLVRANSEYSDVNFNNLYQHDYYFGSEYIDYLHDRDSLETNFRHRINDLERNRFITNKSKVVEVGCAYGFFLNLVESHVSSVVGFDVTKEGVEYAKKTFGVDAYCEDFLKTSIRKVDCVCMWDVIEHLPNPKDFIIKASSVLNKGGVLALTTGDHGSVLAQIQGEKWRLIHPPTHLFYFDKKTITKLLENNGFEVVRIHYPFVYRNFGSAVEQIMGNKPLLIKNIVYWFLRCFHLDKISIGVNLLDIFEVVAKKV